MEKYDILIKLYLGMAQIGSALPWGGRGRLFKSGHSDQYVKTAFLYCGEPFFSCQNILTQKSSDGKSELLVLYYIFASFANSAFSAG